MPTNSSSNIFLSSPLICSFNASLYPVIFSCFTNTTNSIHYHLYMATNTLLILPLYIFIFWMGFQKWRRQSPASGQTSNIDVFTYCMASTETIAVFGLFSYSYAISACRTTNLVLGYFCLFIGSSAQTLFHCLTCIERYLAVVHPIIYLKLNRSHGVTTRNISIVCVWLLSFGLISFVAVFFPVFPISLYFTIFGFIVVIMCFCSISVFCVLMCSRMGRDQTKWRAFHTIVGITATLVLRFSGQTASMLILHSVHGAELYYCEIFMSGSWLCLPSSLVLPLLFLHRNGKVTCH